MAAANGAPVKDVAIPDLSAKTGDDDDADTASPSPSST
jgi:hypothetical protein